MYQQKMEKAEQFLQKVASKLEWETEDVIFSNMTIKTLIEDSDGDVYYVPIVGAFVEDGFIYVEVYTQKVWENPTDEQLTEIVEAAIAAHNSKNSWLRE